MHTLTKTDGAYPLYGADDSGTPTDGGVAVLRYGLRWEPVKAERKGLMGWAERKKRELEEATDPADWDAGAIFLANGDPKKYIGFGSTDPFKDETTEAQRHCASHSGDSVRGDGDGDDEAVDLRLADIPQRYDRVLLLGGAYKKGSQVDAVRDVKATVYDGTGGAFTAVGEYEPSLLGAQRMIVSARLDRDPASGLWSLSVVGESYDITPGDFRSLLRNAMRLS